MFLATSPDHYLLISIDSHSLAEVMKRDSVDLGPYNTRHNGSRFCHENSSVVRLGFPLFALSANVTHLKFHLTLARLKSVAESLQNDFKTKDGMLYDYILIWSPHKRRTEVILLKSIYTSCRRQRSPVTS